MSLEGSWVLRGYFDVAGQVPAIMPAVRNELCKRLRLPRGKLEIANYPVGPNFKYLYWWREGTTEYAEAQFVAAISKADPVLSLGLAIEKGFDDRARPGRPLMDRRTWDWPHLVKHVHKILSTDAVATTAAIRGPFNLRIRSKKSKAPEWETRALSFAKRHWYERHVGPVQPEVISEHIRELDRRPDSWVIVHFARDLSPAEADGLSASQAAGILFGFDRMRRRLRP